MKTKICEICEKEFEVLKSSTKTCSKTCSYKLRKLTRNTMHKPQEKNCVDCQMTFLDTSKKKLVDRCKDCISKKMVESRKRNGTYERSKEQNEKLSTTLKKKYESGWNPNTEEHCEKLSASMKRRWSDGSMAEKSRETCLQKYGEVHWSKTQVGKSFISKLKNGKKLSKESCQKMSVSASKRIRNKRETCYTSARGGIRKDLDNKYFRSCWEANFARILNHLGKSWEYEPKTFAFSDGKSYTPDFYCDGIYYEIKGRMTQNCEAKLLQMKKEYPNVPLELVDGEKYGELKVRYKNLLPSWEGK